MTKMILTFLMISISAGLAQAKDMTDYEPDGWEMVVNCQKSSANQDVTANAYRGASGKFYFILKSGSTKATQIYFSPSEGLSTRALRLARAGESVNLVLSNDLVNNGFLLYLDVSPIIGLTRFSANNKVFSFLCSLVNHD